MSSLIKVAIASAIGVVLFWLLNVFVRWDVAWVTHLGEWRQFERVGLCFVFAAIVYLSIIAGVMWAILPGEEDNNDR